METVPDGYKRCSGDEQFSCGEIKPVEDFYAKRPGEYQSLCKLCFNARRKARYAAKPDTEKSKAAEWQRENREKTAKYQAKSRAKNQDSVIESSRRYEAKPETQAMRAQYKAEHEADIDAYNARYRLAHQEEIRRYNAGYRAGRKAELAERQRLWIKDHPEQDQARHRKWKRANKDKVNTATNNRRARIKGLEGSYTTAELQALYDYYDRTCLWCRRQEPEIKLSPDHVVAVTRKGAQNWIFSLQPLCINAEGTACNNRKNDHNFDFRPFWPGEPPSDEVIRAAFAEDDVLMAQERAEKEGEV